MQTTDREEHQAKRRYGRVLTLALLVTLSGMVLWAAGCDEGTADIADDGDSVTASTEQEGSESGEVEAEVGEPVTVGNARVTVNALQETFQPVLPVQRISEQTPSPPDTGESFYQAYVRVENLATDPVRVDPSDFTCLVGNTVVAIEPARSGPLARSLLKNTSLDLILTFKAEAGFVPELRYNPPWYQGSIRVTPAAGGGTTSTGDTTSEESTTTEE